MQLNGLTLNGARNTRSVHLISVLSSLGQALGQWGWACPSLGQAQPLAGWCWVFSVVHAQMGLCSYIELRVWRCRTNRRTHHSDMPRTSGTHRNTWTDGFGCRHTMLAEYHHCQHLKMWNHSKRRRSAFCVVNNSKTKDLGQQFSIKFSFVNYMCPRENFVI